MMVSNLKRREIGSEFYEIPLAAEDNDVFPKETYWFVSGRSALLAILSENNFHTAAIPFWCCDSMMMPFIKLGIEVQFYTNELPQTDVALVMDYFGYSNTGVSTDDYKGIIIRDLTHSIFSSKYADADYYFGSLRKWAGFFTGGFGWGFNQKVRYKEDNSEYVALRKMAMHAKRDYINGISNDKRFLYMYNKAEKLLGEIGIAEADFDDVRAAKKIDIDLITTTRRNNAKALLKELGDVVIFPVMGEKDCPLFVPIRTKRRNALREFLIIHEIYCPVHWPISKFHNIQNYDRKLYDEELSIVCDQRYSVDDMMRIAQEINKFYSEG